MARTRNGFTPAIRKQLAERFQLDRAINVRSPICPKPKVVYGGGPYSRQDEGLSLAKAGAGRTIRILLSGLPGTIYATLNSSLCVKTKTRNDGNESTP